MKKTLILLWTEYVHIQTAGMYLGFRFEGDYLRKCVCVWGGGLFTEEGAFYTNAIYHFAK